MNMDYINAISTGYLDKHKNEIKLEDKLRFDNGYIYTAELNEKNVLVLKDGRFCFIASKIAIDNIFYSAEIVSEKGKS